MSDLVEKTFARAVKDLKNEWLSSHDKKWYMYITGLPENLQVVYTILVFHNQVFNGRFHQYFSNGYGQFALETIINLRLIHANTKADMLVKAFNFINSKDLKIEDFRNELLNRTISKLFLTDELFDVLEEIDDSYDESNEDIEELLNIPALRSLQLRSLCC